MGLAAAQLPIATITLRPCAIQIRAVGRETHEDPTGSGGSLDFYRVFGRNPDVSIECPQEDDAVEEGEEREPCDPDVRAERAVVQAKLAVRVNSEIGRTEYLLVGLVETNIDDAGPGFRDVGPGFSPAIHRSGPASLVAYPMGQGSGSVSGGVPFAYQHSKQNVRTRQNQVKLLGGNAFTWLVW